MVDLGAYFLNHGLPRRPFETEPGNKSLRRGSDEERRSGAESTEFPCDFNYLNSPNSPAHSHCDVDFVKRVRSNFDSPIGDLFHHIITLQALFAVLLSDSQLK